MKLRGGPRGELVGRETVPGARGGFAHPRADSSVQGSPGHPLPEEASWGRSAGGGDGEGVGTGLDCFSMDLFGGNKS